MKYYKKQLLPTCLMMLFLIILNLSNDLKAQCEMDSIRLSRFEIDTVLHFPQLTVKNQEIFPLLDDILKYTVLFNFDKDSVGVYFRIFYYEDKNENSFSVSLLQRNDKFETFFFLDYYSVIKHKCYGMFCYKGYLFFVITTSSPAEFVPKQIEDLFTKTGENVDYVEYKKNYVKTSWEVPVMFNKSYFYIDGKFKFEKDYNYIWDNIKIDERKW